MAGFCKTAQRYCFYVTLAGVLVVCLLNFRNFAARNEIYPSRFSSLPSPYLVLVYRQGRGREKVGTGRGEGGRLEFSRATGGCLNHYI